MGSSYGTRPLPLDFLPQKRAGPRRETASPNRFGPDVSEGNFQDALDLTLGR